MWDVGDEATAVFMDQLYYELGRGRRPAEAVRRTKQRLRESATWGPPHLWSGYVLVGETGPVVARRRWPWLVAAGGAAAGGAAAALVALSLRRRRASPS